MQNYNNYSKSPNHPHPDAPLSAPQHALMRFVVFSATDMRNYPPLGLESTNPITA